MESGGSRVRRVRRIARTSGAGAETPNATIRATSEKRAVGEAHTHTTCLQVGIPPKGGPPATGSSKRERAAAHWYEMYQELAAKGDADMRILTDDKSMAMHEYQSAEGHVALLQYFQALRD